MEMAALSSHGLRACRETGGGKESRRETEKEPERPTIRPVLSEQGPTLVTSFNFNYLLIGFMSPCRPFAG